MTTRRGGGGEGGEYLVKTSRGPSTARASNRQDTLRNSFIHSLRLRDAELKQSIKRIDTKRVNDYKKKFMNEYHETYQTFREFDLDDLGDNHKIGAHLSALKDPHDRLAFVDYIVRMKEDNKEDIELNKIKKNALLSCLEGLGEFGSGAEDQSNRNLSGPVQQKGPATAVHRVKITRPQSRIAPAIPKLAFDQLKLQPTENTSSKPHDSKHFFVLSTAPLATTQESQRPIDPQLILTTESSHPKTDRKDKLLDLQDQHEPLSHDKLPDTSLPLDNQVVLAVRSTRGSRRSLVPGERRSTRRLSTMMYNAEGEVVLHRDSERNIHLHNPLRRSERDLTATHSGQPANTSQHPQRTLDSPRSQRDVLMDEIHKVMEQKTQHINSQVLDSLKRQKVLDRIEKKNQASEAEKRRLAEVEATKILSTAQSGGLFNNFYKQQAKQNMADTLARIILREDGGAPENKFYAFMTSKPQKNVLSGIQSLHEQKFLAAHEAQLREISSKLNSFKAKTGTSVAARERLREKAMHRLQNFPFQFQSNVPDREGKYPREMIKNPFSPANPLRSPSASPKKKKVFFASAVSVHPSPRDYPQNNRRIQMQRTGTVVGGNIRREDMVGYYELLRFKERQRVPGKQMEEDDSCSIDSATELHLHRNYEQAIVLNDKLETIDGFNFRNEQIKGVQEAISQRLEDIVHDVDVVNAKRLERSRQYEHC